MEREHTTLYDFCKMSPILNFEILNLAKKYWYHSIDERILNDYNVRGKYRENGSIFKQCARSGKQGLNFAVWVVSAAWEV